MEKRLTRKITQDEFVTEKNDIIKNNLLGNYDDNNEYHISSQIVEELIAIDKLKKSTFGNSIFCIGNLLGYGEIVFEVVYNNKSSNSSAQAFLFVLENVDKINGYLQNTIRTQIAHFTSDLDDFIEESYKKFNIVGTLDDEGREKKNLDDMNLEDSYILAKKAYSLLLDKLGDEKVLDAYGKYFTARLSALTKFDNAFTNDVLGRFNEEYTLIHGVFLQEKNYKTLNELLDKCIEEASGIKPEYVQLENDFNAAIKPDLDKFVSNMETISEKSEDKAIDMLEKSDREKIKEILSSDEKFEKDLSDEDMRSDVDAPRQTLETLANEIEGMSPEEEQTMEGEIVSSEEVSEEIGEETSDEIEEEIIADESEPVVDSEKEREDENITENEQEALDQLFGGAEEVLESDSGLMGQLRDYVSSSQVEKEEETMVDEEISESDEPTEEMTGEVIEEPAYDRTKTRLADLAERAQYTKDVRELLTKKPDKVDERSEDSSRDPVTEEMNARVNRIGELFDRMSSMDR